MLTITVSKYLQKVNNYRLSVQSEHMYTDLTTTKSYSTFVAAPNPCPNSERQLSS